MNILTHKQSGVYAIVNKTNGRRYIGSAVNIEQRWKQHVSHLRQNKHHSKYLQRAWNKYGESSFEFVVLRACSTGKLLEIEQYYLDTLSSEYNISKVAGSRQGVPHSEETKKKLSIMQIGRKATEEWRKNISKALKGHSVSENVIKALKARAGKPGKKHTAEMNRLKSERMTGKKKKPMSEQARINIGNGARGRVPTEQARANMKAAQERRWAEGRGYVFTDEDRKKMSESQKKLWAKKKVENCEETVRDGE